ncbi:5-formyltetrahydrofolate cyclo-ligase [Bradyrhizobium sp. WD16]|uniref:5-formyltetrahydrofolate cyclo-ligase n=1 Tax=Bradyrhizobium sp. WD16 TaxID=1521768 RepID=UPI0020A538ED|nr:5-formyltetrahydrofolate cyclo-ligase [Bradyrhizobium sp. WD16]UTD27256.1 5-formyltetrahydrofolate cyclo-ligase [Bradyrhizobium sp. WD16]
MTVADAKSFLRKVALARRDSLSAAERAAAAQAIAARGLPVALDVGTIVAGYAAIRSEIDPAPLMQLLAARGACLALPAVVASDASLVFRAWSVGAPSFLGRFGIAEPAADAPLLVPQIILLPLAAFDRGGHRIGYGAGYYDRTLAGLHTQGLRPITIGIAAAVQEIGRVPALPHDASLDYIATERELIETRSTQVADSLYR